MDFTIPESTANEVIKDLHLSIDAENKFIKEEHELHIKLESFHSLFGYIDGYSKIDSVHDLNHLIIESIMKITSYIQENELYDIGFIKEEKENFKKLDFELYHKDWQIVHKDLTKKVGDKKEFIRTESNHLVELHRLFLELIKDMDKSKLLKSINEKTEFGNKMRTVAKKEIKLFSEVYKFLNMYEHVLRHLIIKEKHLLKKLNKNLNI